MKYSEIKTMSQLEEAQRQVKRRVKKKGEAVKDSFRDMKESYSPGNMLLFGLRSVSSYVPVDQFLLTTVRRLKKSLSK